LVLLGATEILSGHVSGAVMLPSLRAPEAGIDSRLDAVILKCLEKDPGRRFATADELGAALGDVADARQALSRLDEPKRTLVLDLCEKNGVKLY
jgi:hypothetical protein